MRIIQQTQRGFSLIEIVIVIGIIGIVVAIMSTPLTGIQSRGRDDRRKLDIEEIQVGLAQSHANQPGGFYPMSINTLVTDRYLDALPIDPSTKTSAAYVSAYSPLPALCDNTINNFCLDYQISITLESGDPYTVGPHDL